MIDLIIFEVCFWCYTGCFLCFAFYFASGRNKTVLDVLDVLLAGTFVVHFLFFAARYFSVYYHMETYKFYLPVNTVWEAKMFLAFCNIFIVYIFGYFKENKLIALLNLSIVWGLIYSIRDVDKSLPLVSPPYQTLWMSFYSTASIAGYSFLLISFSITVLYMVKLPIRFVPFLKDSLFDKSIPDSKTLCILVQRFVYYGFPLITLGIIFRACWANLAWGKWWLWNGEEIWSLIAWILYLLYFHVQDNFDGKENVLVLISAAAFIAGIFSYFGGDLLGFNLYKNF